MKVKVDNYLQFSKSDVVTESLKPVKAASCYSLPVAFSSVNTEIGISLLAS
jgi:hypothetical protein